MIKMTHPVCFSKYNGQVCILYNCVCVCIHVVAGYFQRKWQALFFFNLLQNTTHASFDVQLCVFHHPTVAYSDSCISGFQYGVNSSLPPK